MESVKTDYLYYQFTHGCTCLYCNCIYCCSCKNFVYQFMDDATYKQYANEIAESNDWEKYICKNVSPLFINPSLSS